MKRYISKSISSSLQKGSSDVFLVGSNGQCVGNFGLSLVHFKKVLFVKYDFFSNNLLESMDQPKVYSSLVRFNRKYSSLGLSNEVLETII